MIEVLTVWTLFMAIVTPIMCIVSFIVGYNVNAPKKIMAKKLKKSEPTDDEIMLERIDNARI